MVKSLIINKGACPKWVPMQDNPRLEKMTKDSLRKIKIIKVLQII